MHFSREKTDESFLGTGGIQWEPFGLLTGCDGTMAEGGREAAAGL